MAKKKRKPARQFHNPNDLGALLFNSNEPVGDIEDLTMVMLDSTPHTNYRANDLGDIMLTGTPVGGFEELSAGKMGAGYDSSNVGYYDSSGKKRNAAKTSMGKSQPKAEMTNIKPMNMKPMSGSAKSSSGLGGMGLGAGKPGSSGLGDMELGDVTGFDELGAGKPGSSGFDELGAGKPGSSGLDELGAGKPGFTGLDELGAGKPGSSGLGDIELGDTTDLQGLEAGRYDSSIPPRKRPVRKRKLRSVRKQMPSAEIRSMRKRTRSPMDNNLMGMDMKKAVLPARSRPMPTKPANPTFGGRNRNPRPPRGLGRRFKKGPM